MEGSNPLIHGESATQYITGDMVFSNLQDIFMEQVTRVTQSAQQGMSDIMALTLFLDLVRDNTNIRAPFDDLGVDQPNYSRPANEILQKLNTVINLVEEFLRNQASTSGRQASATSESEIAEAQAEQAVLQKSQSAGTDFSDLSRADTEVIDLMGLDPKTSSQAFINKYNQLTGKQQLITILRKLEGSLRKKRSPELIRNNLELLFTKTRSKQNVKEFIIKPPKSTDEGREKVDKILPQMPFRILVVGNSASGKGVLCNNFLGSNTQFPYKNIFKKNIFLFSSTYALGDKSLANMEIPEENTFDNLDEDIIRQILLEQKLNIAEFGKDKCVPILILLDDVLTQLSHKKNSIVRELFFSSRHYLINLFFMVQSYRGVPKAMRTNCTHLIFFQTNNTKERNSIIEEQNAPGKVMEKILDDATEEDYSFLVVNNKIHDKNLRFQKRFSTEYYIIDNV